MFFPVSPIIVTVRAVVFFFLRRRQSPEGGDCFTDIWNFYVLYFMLQSFRDDGKISEITPDFNQRDRVHPIIL